jgi:hypothetical protein
MGMELDELAYWLEEAGAFQTELNQAQEQAARP